MEQIIVIIILIIFLIFLRKILSCNIKELKQFKNRDELNKLTEELPENVEIAKTITKKLKNESVNIKEEEKLQATIYMIVNNTISISKSEKNYTRLQTISHECLHSIQSKIVLWFNFIFSNIYLLYFLIIFVLTLFNIITQPMLQISILLASSIVQYAVRSYLEIDAMAKAKYIAKEYLDEETTWSEENKKILLAEYEKINEKGIPMVCYKLLESNLIKVILYAVVSII